MDEDHALAIALGVLLLLCGVGVLWSAWTHRSTPEYEQYIDVV
jgi:hypothetical protein